MPAKKSQDPLIPVTLRLPASQLMALRSGSSEDVTLSDLIRNRLNLDGVKPLANPRPRRRKHVIDSGVRLADPALMRQVAAIGSNLNQIARAVNRQVAAGAGITLIDLLTALVTIEQNLTRLVSRSEFPASAPDGAE